MTAVAPPLTSFQSNNRIGWSPNNSNGFGAMTSEDSRMFNGAGPRKTAQRQNSSSSIASTASSASTVSAAPTTTNGTTQNYNDANGWAVKKKPSRGLWPPGKAEPATGISTARPQTISSATSGPTASSTISALHGPMMSSQQMANGTAQSNGVVREQSQNASPAILSLIPMNGTFERKTIQVPFSPEVVRIGRQTNAKTVPTPSNGYFDSKVLSRQHAEIYADRNGRIYIRDVKSSNGTFVNGLRLSQENKESEPRELHEQDMLELGIDIVSEDQKTVVHHKVAAKVEHAGIYGPGTDTLNFADLDPSNGPPLLGGPHQLKRNGSQGSMNGRAPSVSSGVSQAAYNMGISNQQPGSRPWLNPIATEQLVRKIDREIRLAMHQSQEIARARQMLEMLGQKVEPVAKDVKTGSEKNKASPTRAKIDLKAHFSGPPAPPPQAPLPEKPDVAKALADPVIQPLLRRSDTARPELLSYSPTRTDYSGDILRLCEELKLAKGELSNQNERMRSLENELAQERTARESAEERAQRLERGEDDRKDVSPKMLNSEIARSGASSPEIQLQLDRLTASMDEMKQQMEAYRQRATIAEAERDEARQSLAEMIERKRREYREHARTSSSSSKSSASPSNKEIPTAQLDTSDTNGHAVSPVLQSPTSESLLEHAGIESGQPITEEQARLITDFLTKEVLHPSSKTRFGDGDNPLVYYGLPYGSFAAVVLLGYIAMTWINGWPLKVER